MKIAIIGGGIVGSTCAFYLARDGHSVTLFDEGTGQATKAAAGIICPWLSQRRNKIWYRLTAQGAAFYAQLLADLGDLGIESDFYRKTGTLVFKKNDDLLDKLETIAIMRQKDAPAIQEVIRLSQDAIENMVPEVSPQGDALLATGGAVVDGAQFTQALQKAASCFDFTFLAQEASLSLLMGQYDRIIVAAGPSVKPLLEPLLEPFGYVVDVRPQKGQLFEVQLKNKKTKHYPVFMPQGEFDLLPFEDGRWVIGATHENEQGFGLRPDMELLEEMKADAAAWLPELAKVDITKVRVGTRAYTSDYSPFFGPVPELEGVFTASGLGSSGLTSGPYIGYLLAQMVQGQVPDFPVEDYATEKYIKKH